MGCVPKISKTHCKTNENSPNWQPQSKPTTRPIYEHGGVAFQHVFRFSRVCTIPKFAYIVYPTQFLIHLISCCGCSGSNIFGAPHVQHIRIGRLMCDSCGWFEGMPRSSPNTPNQHTISTISFKSAAKTISNPSVACIGLCCVFGGLLFIKLQILAGRHHPHAHRSAGWWV